MGLKKGDELNESKKRGQVEWVLKRERVEWCSKKGTS